ncbi:MAG: peptidoglycan DD-metalloendopeptidase family protein, partial [Anaerolineales bacterium]
FLYPPFPGRAVQSSIFDHSNPNYTQSDRLIVLYSGDVAQKDCPNPPPPGTPPPRGVCDLGYGIYWSYTLGDWIYYNGHDGIDYAFNYRPIYAAANAEQVVYAGWWDPQNHRSALGLYVKLRHANGYSTVYGHMSALAVQSCTTAPCPLIRQGDVIGYSGNTGNSTGPHLHFSVFNAANKPVDPYGWGGEEGADPWIYNPSNPLWVAYPALEYYGARILPSGDPLPYPTPPSGGRIVDDGSVNFDETPKNCWTRVYTQSAQGGLMRYAPASATVTCTATWQLPPGSSAGLYAVYVRIPSIHATTEGAVYTIRHQGRNDRIVLSQAPFPNSSVPDGWLFLGRYEFNGQGDEYVRLTNQTQDESAKMGVLEVGVDAVQFVFLGNVTPTPPQPQ